MWRASALLAEVGIPHGFSIAKHGDFRRIDLPPGVATARQVHGLFALAARQAGRLDAEADALWSARPDVAVGVLTADCVPLLLADPVAGLVAAVHAGWRGTLGRVLDPAVAALCAAGARPERMHAAVGPAIRVCCYRVGPELLSDFAHAFGTGVTGAEGRLDLVASNVQQLLALGIPPTQVDDLGDCTACARENSGAGSGVYRYFSHRRDPLAAGRQLSWVGAQH